MRAPDVKARAGKDALERYLAQVFAPGPIGSQRRQVHKTARVHLARQAFDQPDALGRFVSHHRPREDPFRIGEYRVHNRLPFPLGERGDNKAVAPALGFGNERRLIDQPGVGDQVDAEALDQSLERAEPLGADRVHRPGNEEAGPFAHEIQFAGHPIRIGIGSENFREINDEGEVPAGSLGEFALR